MLKSSLWDYSDAYIFVSTNLTVPNTGTVASPNNRKIVLFKDCGPFTYCINEINNTQIDNAKNTDIVMSMYNSIEYRLEIYANNLWQEPS